jgi:type IV pilus assembly protein PilC
MNYDYVGYTPEKKLVKGSIAAPDEEGAIEILASYGYKILKLVPVKSFKPNWERLFPSFFKVKPEEIIVFSRQLTLLTEAGTDLVAAIKLLQRQVSNKVLRRALGAIVSDIRSGTRVADAMGKYPDIFSKIYCRSVRVGEQTGELGMMLTQIADYMENESVGRKGLKSAMTYPIVVSVVAVGVVILLVNFVLPTFESLYLTLGADLPMITRIFLDVAGSFSSYGIYLIAVLVSGHRRENIPWIN